MRYKARQVRAYHISLVTCRQAGLASSTASHCPYQPTRADRPTERPTPPPPLCHAAHYVHSGWRHNHALISSRACCVVVIVITRRCRHACVRACCPTVCSVRRGPCRSAAALGLTPCVCVCVYASSLRDQPIERGDCEVVAVVVFVVVVSICFGSLAFGRVHPHWGCLPATVPSLTCPRRARTLLTTRSYRNVGAAEIEHLYSLSMGAVTNAPPDVVKSKYTCIITRRNRRYYHGRWNG